MVRRSVFVNPSEQLASEIIELTGITQSDVDSGVDLKTAYLSMLKDAKHHNVLHLIHQWGIPDAHLLKRQLGNDTLWRFGRRWIDVKALAQTFAIINGKKFVGGLKKMASMLRVEMSKDQAHRADYDAEITFKVHCQLANFFLLTQSEKENMPVYRHLKSAIHNFASSFMSQINNIDDQPVIEIISRHFQKNPSDQLSFYFLPQIKLTSEHEADSRLLASLHRYNGWLPKHLENNKAAISLINELYFKVTKDEDFLLLKSFSRDNRGKTYELILKEGFGG